MSSMIFSNIVCRTSLPLSASQTRTYSMASSVFSVTTDHFTWHDPAFRRGPSRALDQLIASNRFSTSPKVKAYLGHSAIILVGPQLQPHGRDFTLSMPETESGTGWSTGRPSEKTDASFCWRQQWLAATAHVIPRTLRILRT